MATPEVHVYIATSLDGFIAGPDDDVSWLDGPEDRSARADPPSGSGFLSYDDFIVGVGALLMGRRSYDVVRGFGGPWPYEDLPVLVGTHRTLDANPPPTVRAVRGPIANLIRWAKEAAGERNVYIDGGDLIRQAAQADLIDELTITVAPIVLGHGIPLFAGMARRYPLEIISHHSHPGGMVQVRARPRGR